MKISDVSALGGPLLSQEVDGIICGNGLSVGHEMSPLDRYRALFDSSCIVLQSDRYVGISTNYQEHSHVIPLLKSDVYKTSVKRDSGSITSDGGDTANVVDYNTPIMGHHHQPKSQYYVTSMNPSITNGGLICGIDSATV